MKDEYEELARGENVRENLSFLRGEVKKEENRAALAAMDGIAETLAALLRDGDAKVRKNAALLSGDLRLSGMGQALFDAYRDEGTLFVKSAYVTALGKVGAEPYIPYFKKRLEELKNSPAPEDEKKHRGEEIRELTKLVAADGGGKTHKFTGLKTPHPMLLTARREFRDTVLAEAEELGSEICRRAERHPLGALVFSREAAAVAGLRTYRELLFPLYFEEPPEETDGGPQAGRKQRRKRPVVIPAGAAPKETAALLWQSELFSFLSGCHDGDEPFRFRLEYKGDKPQTEYVKKLGQALEAESGWRLVNAAGAYELELRMIPRSDGGYVSFVKLSTIPCRRFSYRKNAVAASIHPADAAALVWLAKPYLKENARILDPCCGVGTMLIERDLCVPARRLCGIDTFGDAILMARENAAASGEEISFFHRDCLDFKSENVFDEIISNLPERGKKTKAEQDGFYASFFQKAGELLAAGGVMVLHTNEVGFVKKQIRLHPAFRLLAEHCVREKDDSYLFIIGYKR